MELVVGVTQNSTERYWDIRIVFSQDIPTAGLYRHGAAYIKPPAGT